MARKRKNYDEDNQENENDNKIKTSPSCKNLKILGETEQNKDDIINGLENFSLNEKNSDESDENEKKINTTNIVFLSSGKKFSKNKGENKKDDYDDGVFF